MTAAVVAMAVAMGTMAVASARPAAAGGAVWQAIGPSGGGAEFVTMDPTAPATLYASTTFRIFKTVDGGQTWTAADQGIARTPFIGAVTVDPMVPATLYAATYSGVWGSHDGGASWRQLLAQAGSCTKVVLDPSAHKTLYIGLGSKVWKSTDAGATWTASDLPAGLNTFTLAIDPRRPATLYVGTDSGVLRSTNGGGSWARSGGATLAGRFIFSLAADPYTEGRVWAGVSAVTTSGAGLFVSRDSGASWQGVPQIDRGVGCVTVSPAHGHPVYACANQGILRSNDGGSTWQPLDNGLPSSNFTPALGSLVVDPTAPDHLYTGVNNSSHSGPAVYSSIDGGGSWQGIGEGIYGLQITALAVDPEAAGTVYAGTGALSLLRSTDNGGSWAPAASGLNGIDILALALDPLLPSTVYAMTDRAFFASHDRGQTWARPGARFPGSYLLAAKPGVTGTLYASAGALAASTDGGAVWSSPPGAPSDATIVATSAADPATLYVAGGLGSAPGTNLLYLSRDGGATFAQLPAPQGLVLSLAADPTDADTLYASLAGQTFAQSGLYKTTDAGQTWHLLISPGEMTALAVDPGNPSTLYGADFLGTDVVVSRDAGATWSELAPGLPMTVTAHLAFGPAGTLYAGTDTAGVYRVSLPATQ